MYVAEAWGVVVGKLVTLALAGLGVRVIVLMAQDGGWGWLVAAPFLLAGIALALWVGLVAFNGLVRDRLRPEVRFRRLRGTARRHRARPVGEPAAVDTADPVDPVDHPVPTLRSSPRGQSDLLLRTALYVVLGLPSAYLVGYVLLAYLDHLWLMWSSPVVDEWEWDAPEHLGAFGAWFFADAARGRALPMLISAVFLGLGITLATLAVPVLRRRGADAIDLAVTDTGVVTRGGLAIDWDEVVGVLVVQDVRIGAWTSRREGPAFPTRFVLHPTYVPTHSRTRVALELDDLAGVAARAARSQRRALYADGDLASGYALADLWTHPADRVDEILAPLEAAARVARVPVRRLERVTDPAKVLG
ncbi:hypothetical protein ACH436_20160 [Isoptericola sp. NPDC019693]|uniref:hypothetical protein n=1 Tax=Isoptericola sp. NPDC019693 TaxID=3364009 RepID=UPI0037B6390A